MPWRAAASVSPGGPAARAPGSVDPAAAAPARARPLGGPPFIVPHVGEDFAEGLAQRVGLSTGVGAFLLGVYLALQVGGLVLIAWGRRVGWVITFWASAVWTVVAVVDHGPAVLAGGF